MKRFSKYLSVLLVLTLALSACAPSVNAPEVAEDSEPTVQPEATTASEQAEQADSSGVFTASAQGFGGEVTVSLTITDGILSNVAATGNDETAGIGSRAIELMPGLMVSANSVEVDGISGATLTSTAILQAAKDALAQSGVTLQQQAVSVVQKMTPGTYYGEAYGKWKANTIEGERFGSPLDIQPTKVAVTVDETSILSVEVLETSDNPGFIEPCMERIPAAIVNQQSIAVDVVTGATLTSQAILNCVTQALTEAGADLSGFMTAKEKSAAVEEYTADMVVVGSGAAGTMAALTAMEAGKSVIILEKCGKVGGLSALATGMAAVESKHQIEAGNTKTVEEMFSEMMDYTSWRANAPLVLNILEHSGGVVDDLYDYWEQTDYIGFTGFNTAHQACDTKKSTYRLQVLYDQFLEPAGAELMLETRATSLIKENNAVAGVNAIRQDGTKVVIHADAVVVATGGFGGNKEMLEEYIGTSSFYLNGVDTNTGDGINMCLEVGATLSNDIRPHLSEYCGNVNVDIFSGYLKYINQCGFLALNPAGQRFVNEELFFTDILSTGGSALLNVGYAYIIFTQADLDALHAGGAPALLDQETIDAILKDPNQIARITKPNGYPTIKDELNAAIEAGEAWKADSLEELGAKIGFDAEVYGQTISDYLACVESGEDTLFGKYPTMLRSLAEGPYYALRVCNVIFGTYNGIRVNSNCQALDENYQPIPGLYVAGQDSGNYFSWPYYQGAGWTYGYAWTSGRVAAEHFVLNS